jgi:hypothetical protein
MALVDITATGEDNLLDIEDLEDLFSEEIGYRDRQLLRLKDEILDMTFKTGFPSPNLP